MKISEIWKYLKTAGDGLWTFLQTPGLQARGDLLLGGISGYADTGRNGPDISDAFRIASGGFLGAGIGTFHQIGLNSDSTMSQAQYAPTGNSVFGNSRGLDNFFANAPQSIGSNFYNTQPLSSFGLSSFGRSSFDQFTAPQYGQLPDLSNNAWYTGTGAGSMGPNIQPLSSFGLSSFDQFTAPQYGQLSDPSNNAWYQGPGAGSTGPVPPVPRAPVQAVFASFRA